VKPLVVNTRKALHQAIFIGAGTFLLAILIGLGSQGLLDKIKSLVISFALLGSIILIGIVFDVIGVAAAAATEVPFHSRAAKKVLGARQAIWLVRHADRVSSFCNDVVGDVCGTLSGAVGASVLLRLLVDGSGPGDILAGTLMTAFIAALTVGGKALSKNLAINEAHDIIFHVGFLLAWLERTTGMNFTNSPRSPRQKRRHI